MSLQKFNKQDVQIVETDRVYNGFFKVDKLYVKHKLFSGGWTGEIAREIFERGHAVAMLPYDPVRDEIVLIEQFRVGALDTVATPWLLEIIAGMIDEGEEPDDVCRREAMEEAGLTVGKLVKIMQYLPSPGGMTESIHLYIGAVDATNAGGIHGLESENEDIRVHRLPRLKVLQMLKAGKFDNSAIIIALQWFALNFDDIKKQLLDE
ncbi:MAG: ADP-ribose diphosphatase [Aestuariibacter sp.]